MLFDVDEEKKENRSCRGNLDNTLRHRTTMIPGFLIVALHIFLGGTFFHIFSGTFLVLENLNNIGKMFFSIGDVVDLYRLWSYGVTQ